MERNLLRARSYDNREKVRSDHLLLSGDGFPAVGLAPSDERVWRLDHFGALGDFDRNG